MPKQIVTTTSLPKILRVLDRWEDRLTWPLFCAQVSKVLQVDAISRHTLIRYPTILHRFQMRQQELRESAKQEPRDYTLQAAVKRIREFEAQVSRLEDTNTLLLEKFRRWLYNAHAHNLSVEQLDAPLPAVDRSGHKESHQQKP